MHTQAVAKQLRESIADIQTDMGQRMFEKCLQGTIPKAEAVLLQSDLVKLKRCIFAAHVCTFTMLLTRIIEDNLFW